MTPLSPSDIEAGRTFTREEIVVRLVEKGVPRWRAEKAADEEVVAALRTAPQKRAPRKRYAKSNVDLQAKKFRAWCKANEIPLPVAEYQFHPTRKWRADFAWVNPNGGGVLLEVDGGGHVRGRHHRHAGFVKDQEKRNAAIALGFKPLHVTPQTLFTDSTLDLLKQALEAA